MATTPITVINAATVSNGSTSTPVSKAINTKCQAIEVTITNGSTAQGQGDNLNLCYVVTPSTITNTNVIKQLPDVRTLPIPLNGLAASAVKILHSGEILAAGNTLWMWTQGTLSGNITVTATLQELTLKVDSGLAIAADGSSIVNWGASADRWWQYATPIASPITNTTAVALAAAGAAGVRNYVTGLQYQNTSATASIVTIQDGTTVIWTGYAPASMTFPAAINFETPLKGTAATVMNFKVNTTSTNTFVSAQGYTGA